MTDLVPLLVFSDLDGTLLDHDSYAFDAARPALSALAKIGAPVVLASSKTAPEIAVLRDAMGLRSCPAIVENGAGVLEGGAAPAPDHSESDYTRLRAALDRLSPKLRTSYHGFGDMTVDDVAAATGLSRDGAALAKSRAHSEPGLWQGPEADLPAFLAALAEQDIAARRGGRFLTLSFGGTKADQMARIAAAYGAPFTLALGDAPNDVEMLETADLGIVIANPHNAPLPLLRGEQTGRIRRSVKPGPHGWNTEVLRVVMERWGN